jgi:tRNA (cmo5U34)-methyltransferase
MTEEEHENSKYQTLLQATRQDRIYTTLEASAFAFGDSVAAVFDDMISRSVPYYLDLQLLSSSCAVKFYQPGTKIYDLGCSTATTLALIAKRLPSVKDLIGIDSSIPMLEKAEEKLKNLGVRDQISLLNRPLLDESNNEAFNFEPSSLIIANYTLQFLPFKDREKLLKNIFKCLVPGGALLVTEKTIPTKEAEDIIRNLHEDFKHQNGYSLSEIARKRDSLVGVMQPISEQENLDLFNSAGAKKTIEVMRGYSFVSWLCIN